MRIVPDTNIIISALLWGGKPLLLLEAAEKKNLSIFSTEPLLSELSAVLSRKKFAGMMQSYGIAVGDLLERYRRMVVIVTPADIVRPCIIEDPTDDEVLACAVAAQADAIVSGDQHLLALEFFNGIPIYAAAELLARL